MSKRLPVVLEDRELAIIQRVARAQHLTVSDWVRRTLRTAQEAYPTVDAGKKIQVVREAVQHGYPTSDIQGMLRDIEQGYTDPGAG